MHYKCKHVSTQTSQLADFSVGRRGTPRTLHRRDLYNSLDDTSEEHDTRYYIFILLLTWSNDPAWTNGWLRLGVTLHDSFSTRMVITRHATLRTLWFIHVQSSCYHSGCLGEQRSKQTWFWASVTCWERWRTQFRNISTVKRKKQRINSFVILTQEE